MSDLGEWALAGKRLGTVLVWFLIGADLYTAYTFISVPSGVYAGIFGVPGTGSFYFFAVPYVALTFGIAIVVMPKLWKVAHERGYITAADFVKGVLKIPTATPLCARPVPARQLRQSPNLSPSGARAPQAYIGNMGERCRACDQETRSPPS